VLGGLHPHFATSPSGESLAGYVLTLDEMNLLDAGRVLKLVRRIQASPRKIGRPGYFINASTIDLATLSPLAGGASIEQLERLTAIPVLRWLYGSSEKVVRPHSIGFRVCPGCIRQRHIPLVSLFADIKGCADHALALVDRCGSGCHAAIALFMGQDLPFTCHEIGCARRYEDLEARPLTAAELFDLRQRVAVYQDLFEFAVSGPARVLSQAVLARALHALIATNLAAEPLRVRVGRRPSLALVVEVLAATGSTARDLDRQLRSLVPPQTLRPQPGPSGCPNPKCGANLGRTTADPLLRCAGESQCRICGTRFTRDRILFSFDEQPGYRSVFAFRNNARLARHRERLNALCDRWLAEDRVITREAALREAGIRPSIVPHLSERAGLCAIVEAAQARQRRRRIDRQQAEVAAVDPADADLRERVALLGLAHAIGVAEACKRQGIQRSRYYRWKSAFERGGLAGLQATCPKRGAKASGQRPYPVSAVICGPTRTPKFME
jgi:hypothetical protein